MNPAWSARAEPASTTTFGDGSGMPTELPSPSSAQKLCDNHAAIEGLNKPFMAALPPCLGLRPDAHDSPGSYSPQRAESSNIPPADADPLEFTTTILSMLFNPCHSTKGNEAHLHALDEGEQGRPDPVDIISTTKGPTTCPTSSSIGSAFGEIFDKMGYSQVGEKLRACVAQLLDHNGEAALNKGASPSR